jgi:hypothetical protein
MIVLISDKKQDVFAIEKSTTNNNPDVIDLPAPKLKKGKCLSPIRALVADEVSPALLGSSPTWACASAQTSL